MAKITIAGDSIVITSSKTLEAIKTMEKYRPQTLSLSEKDEDGNKSVVYCIATGTKGVCNGNGAVFASATHDDARLACITMPIPEGVGSVIDYVADKYGRAITMIEKIEAKFDSANAEIEAEKTKILQHIAMV